jgi:uncharacterized protein (UPF0216 family)
VTIDEETLKRWTNLEVHEVNKSTVTKGRRLRDLLSEDEPSARKRDGEDHVFDVDVLERLHDALSPLVRANVRFPITIYFDHQTETGAYIAHEWAIEAVEQLDVTETSEREGKLWLSRSKAIQIAREYETAFQFLLA